MKIENEETRDEAIEALVEDMQRPFSKPVSDVAFAKIMRGYYETLCEIVGDDDPRFADVIKDFRSPVHDYAGRINSPEWVNTCLTSVAKRIEEAYVAVADDSLTTRNEVSEKVGLVMKDMRKIVDSICAFNGRLERAVETLPSGRVLIKKAGVLERFQKILDEMKTSEIPQNKSFAIRIQNLLTAGYDSETVIRSDQPRDRVPTYSKTDTVNESYGRGQP